MITNNVGNLDRRGTITEMAYDDDDPELLLSGLWIPSWHVRTRVPSNVTTPDQGHHWVVTRDVSLLNIEDTDEDEESHTPWYIQRSSINIDPGSYDFWCRLRALLNDRGNFQTEE